MNRLNLIAAINDARVDGSLAAANNDGWESNPFAVGTPEWFCWCSGFKHTLEDLIRRELARREGGPCQP